jgi:hypothetical protein
MSDLSFSFSNLSQLLDEVLWFPYFEPEDEKEAAIPVLRVPGAKKNPLVVVVGDNAGGKSFFRRVVSVVAGHATKDTEFIHLSMEGRMQSVAWRSFIYGDEQYHCTGENSGGTVLTGIRTCLDRESRHVIFWDEPDLGLSDSWAAGMGQTLAQFSKDATKHTLAAFVVTHSKALVGQLLGTQPTYLHVGKAPEKAPQTLQEWLDAPVAPRDLAQLKEESRKRYRKIQKIMNRRKAS